MFSQSLRGKHFPLKTLYSSMIRIRFLLTNFLKSHQQWRNKQSVYQETTNKHDQQLN